MNKTGTIGFGGICYGLFVDMNNTLYCSLQSVHRVVTKSLYNSTAAMVTVAGTGSSGSLPNKLNNPYGIFVDIDLSLYVADGFNDRIQRFTPGKVNATTVAGNGSSSTFPIRYPSAIALDADGNLFIADGGQHRIVVSGPNGFRCVVACSGVSGSAADHLSSPRAISFDSYGNMYVAEQMNNRIQKFNLALNSCGKHTNETFRVIFPLLSRRVFCIKH